MLLSNIASGHVGRLLCSGGERADVTHAKGPPAKLSHFNTRSSACCCVEWVLASSHVCPKREGKRRHCKDVSTPMEFTWSVFARWPGFLPDDSGVWKPATSATFCPEAHAFLPLTGVWRQQKRETLTRPTQKKLHQSKTLSSLHPSIWP